MFKKGSCVKNRKRQYLFATLLITLFLSANSIVAATYTGTVAPILSALVRYGFNDTDRGIVTYSPRPGQIIYGPILDSKGNEIKKGDLLIQLKSNYHEEEVNAAKADVKLAEAQLAFATKNYKRAIQLGRNTNVISQQTYDNYVATYEESVQGLESAKQALITAQTLYDLVQLRAEYDGIVTKIYMAGALLNNEPPVLQYAALNPMGVKIKIDHTDANKINKLTSTVKVYPVRGDKEARGILVNMTKLTDDGIMLAVPNHMVAPSCDPTKTLIVNNAKPVLRLYTSRSATKPLAVPETCIVKDGQESYVWLLSGNKDNQPRTGVNKIYKAEKVSVKPGQLVKRINNHIDYTELENSGKLAQYDLILMNDNLPSGLKDGTDVYLAENKYVFMPGDSVKIEVSE